MGSPGLAKQPPEDDVESKETSEEPSESTNPANPTVPRACDACRARKVRCDKLAPCSSCRALKVPCRVSPKSNERRQRVLISSKYESKIASIDERLAGIEQSLNLIKLSVENGSPRQTKPPQNPITLHPPPTSSPKSNDGVSYEGDTSLLSHSMNARALFETLTTYTSARQTPALKGAVASLHATLKAQISASHDSELRFCASEVEGKFSIGDLEMPPPQIALEVLRTANLETPRSFLTLPILHFPDFLQSCQSLYFGINDTSPSLFVVVNWGLYYMFAEYSTSAIISPVDKTEYIKYSELCRHNLEITLDNFHISVAPSLETCQALLLGAFHASEVSQPALCKRLITLVAHMTQALGYHRLSSPPPDTKELAAKKDLFWGVYCLDQALSLRLGCTAIIHDCDVSTTMTAPPDDLLLHPWHILFQVWIDMSRFQGRVFSELYTIGTLSGPQEIRVNRARKLALDLESWYPTWRPTLDTYTNVSQPADFRMNVESTDVVHYALLTIVYRAIPPSSSVYSNFSKECVATARKALDVHQTAAAKFQQSVETWQGYITWTLLYSPFAPFMIIFCEAVSNLSRPDLQTLRDFVTSITPKAELESRLTDPALRLHQLCSAFYEVAKVYIEESLSQAPSLLQRSGSIVDQGQGQMQNQNVVLEQLLGMDAGMVWPMEDWFMNDQYMPGILNTGSQV